jgi:4a-hydroxytetrahydrobiopterin dehydratase
MMSEKLHTIRCVGCEGGIPVLTQDEIKPLLLQLNDWNVSSDGKYISKRFIFKGFYKTMAFVNAIAWIANQENHHPDLQIGYDYCLVQYTTHAISGLTKNDFICAAKIDTLMI